MAWPPPPALARFSLSLGTRPTKTSSADLQYVLAAARIATISSAPTVVVDKSTVPVGTADRVRDAMAATLAERGADIAFSVVSNPSFSKIARGD